MSLVWGLPLGLAALAAVLVPLLLHLDGRRAVRIVPFAAMRWIADRHRPRRTLRLTEWLLLLLRVLLVACLAVWLAQPLLRGWSGGTRWLAVAPGIAAQDIAAAATDVERVVWLAPGFPALDDVPSPGGGPSASLLRELDARLAPEDSLRVLVPTTLSGLDAAVISLSREVDWRVAPGASATETETAATPPRKTLALRYADAADAALPYLRAAVEAWKASAAFVVELDEASLDRPWPADADALLQIGGTPDAAALALVEDGATLLQVPSHAAPADTAVTVDAQPSWPPLANRHGRGRIMHLRMPLDPGTLPALHAPDFPHMLHRVLFGEAPPPARAFASQARPVRGAGESPPHEMPLRPWLAWIAAGLFLLERLLANGRRLAGVA